MIFALFLLQFSLSHAEGFLLSEVSLEKELKDGVPTIEKIEAQSAQREFEYSQSEEKFAPSLQFRTEYLNSNEKSFISYIPVTQKNLGQTISVKKMTQYGTELSASLYSHQNSNNIYNNATTTGVGVSVGLDLYKDFLGRSSRAIVENKEIKSKRAKLEKNLQKRNFVVQMKKLYWAIVANAESLKISRKLLSSSEEQLQISKRKFKSGVSDQGEVARYEAQVAQRKAQIISFEYQRSNLFRQLKELVPTLSRKDIVIADYDVDKTVEEVLICSEYIKTLEETPYDSSYYDEIIEILLEEQRLDEKVTSLYSDIDIKLMVSYDSTGKDFGYSKSIDDFQDDGRNTLAMGLQINIPLGRSKSNSEELLNKVQKRMYLAQQLESKAKLDAFHTQTVQSIDYLREVIKNQKRNSFFLSKSIAESKRKYRQARITVEQLVQEQDSLLNSDLQTIESNLAVIHTLYDYFSVFGQTSCSINRTNI